MTTKLTCPHCDASIKLKQSAPGKKIRCPKCGEGFTAPDEEVDDEASPAKAGRARDDDDDDGDEAPQKTKKGAKSKQKAKKSGGGLVLVLALAGAAALLLLVCGGGVTAWWLYAKPTPGPIAKGNGKTDGPPNADRDGKSKGPSPSDEAFLNDPKWKKGDEARAAIVGVWKHAKQDWTLEFAKDGKVLETSYGKKAQFPFSYRIVDPQEFHLSGTQYRLLVGQDEMYWVQSKTLMTGPFRRQ